MSEYINDSLQQEQEEMSEPIAEPLIVSENDMESNHHNDHEDVYQDEVHEIETIEDTSDISADVTSESSTQHASEFVPSESTNQVIDIFRKYVIGNYTRYSACLDHGAGSEVWDIDGKRFIDFFPGWGCNLLGHCPPKVTKAIQEQAGQLLHVPNSWYMKPQGEFAKMLVERSFESRAFFCNSGAEANEAAIKLARAWGAKTDRYKIICAEKSFHGRTYATLSATGQSKYQEGIGPILPGFKHIPFNDLDSLENAMDDDVCAVMIEPIQGEGGVNLMSPEMLTQIRQFCDEKNLLLILDEVQTGMGRTGKWFAFQHSDIEPDIMTLAKALGSGVAVGAMLAKPELSEHLKPGMHASTFGGNPIACCAGIATIETIEEENLLERAESIGQYFQNFFNELKTISSLIEEIRISGCMIGVELTVSAVPIVEECMKRGLLVNATQGNVLRLLPPMNMSDSIMHEGCEILRSVLVQYLTEDSSN